MNFIDIADNEARHLMVFGDPKTGKSTLVSQLARTHKLIWISCDGGHSVLRKLPREAQENIDIIVVPDSRDSPFAYDTVKKLLKGKETSVCHLHGVVACSVCQRAGRPSSVYNFGTLGLDTIVVIDHMTRVSDSCKNVITKGKAEDYKLQLDDWGSLRFYLANLLSDIQVSRFNIVAIAQCEEVKMEDGSKKMNPSIGSAEFTKLTCQYFDSVIYCKVMNRSHRFGSRTTFETSVVTGSRDDVFIEDMEVPELAPFLLLPKPAGKSEYGAGTSTTLPTVPVVDAEVVATPTKAVTPTPATSDMLTRLRSLQKK
jgi:AAA domain